MINLYHMNVKNLTRKINVYFTSQDTIRIAIDRLGGVTKASNLMQVANATIYNWIKRGKVVNIDKAQQLAKLSGITLQQLRNTQ